MSKPRVLAIIPLSAATVEVLDKEFELMHFPDGLSNDVLRMAAQKEPRAIVTNGSTGLSEIQMASFPTLEIVSTFGAGYENVDIDAARHRSICVSNAPGANAATVADHAIGFLLALARGYCQLSHAVKAGYWKRSRTERPTLSGSRLGLIGMGRIGRLVAERARGFSMHIGYYSRHRQPGTDATYYADLVSLAEASDYLVATCPGGRATYHLVNRPVLQALGPSGILVNVSRGTVVNTADLIDALMNHEIAAAGLDVLEDEPSIPEELREMDNVLLTPHIAGRSPASLLAQRDALMQSLREHFAGQPVTLAV